MSLKTLIVPDDSLDMVRFQNLSPVASSTSRARWHMI